MFYLGLSPVFFFNEYGTVHPRLVMKGWQFFPSSLASQFPHTKITSEQPDPWGWIAVMVVPLNASNI